ncbi:DUF937 domain-containing protein [Labrys sp. LIt4]|uniref:DUF937 domain-containing protein n=1 Tax=Labrys sp. LIt4 TaxID=2821355 RepID=UPI001AE0A701|nr:DUF937 domain-containing protein [Labrys sp. LIt4]MBP0581659.1 DUF937 domain-containing protein [Labrys sp. LIt4]
MAINLPSLVSQLITPDLIERTAAIIGIDPALAQKLVGAAIPSVLGAFASEASSPDGARGISDLISSQDPGLFDTLAAGVISGDANSLASGVNVLTPLLGTEGVNQLANVLGQATGAPPQAAASVLGLVGPAVVGALGNQPPESWADGHAISSLFAAEKQAITAALPASLAAGLADSGFLQGLDTAVSGAFRTTPPQSTLGSATPGAQAGTSTLGSTEAAAPASRSTLDTRPPPSPQLQHQAAPPPPPPSSGSMTWLYLIIAVLIVGGLAWYFL